MIETMESIHLQTLQDTAIKTKTIIFIWLREEIDCLII